MKIKINQQQLDIIPPYWGKPREPLKNGVSVSRGTNEDRKQT